MAGVGQLRISQGAVQWKPYKNSKNMRWYDWEQLAAHLLLGGSKARKEGNTIKKVRRAPPAAVAAKRSAAAKKGAATRTAARKAPARKRA